MSRGYRVWDNQEKTYSDKTFSIDQFGCYVQDENDYWKEIDDSRFIVELGTGLTDKNANMIYDGDIIKDTSDGECLINAVFWCEKGGFWGVKPRSPLAERDWGWFIGRDDVEVIGNVHENPELLGGEE